MTNQKQRVSNIELLRIISMCGIIAMHYMNPEIGGAVQNSIFPNFSWFYTHILSSLCVPLVNCFVLISGYFLVSRNIFSLNKIVKLLIITVFYGFIAYMISLLIGNDEFSFIKLLYAIIPFFNGNRWFVETYILLLLFSPFINKTLRSLDKKKYELLIIIQVMVFSVWYSLGLSAPLLDDGYGIINFVTLYMIGGYIHFYGKEFSFYKLKSYILLCAYLLTTLLTFIFSYFTNPFGYAFITNILASVFVFFVFVKCNMGEIKIINKISKATFDIYFVHSDKNTSILLIYNLLGAKYVMDSPWMIIHIIFVIVAIWVLGLATCYIRENIFSITVDKWIDKLNFLKKELEI